MFFERAVKSAAVVLAVAGSVSIVLWALLRHRVRRLGPMLLACSLLALAAGVGLGAWAWHETRSRDVRGSPTIEFSPRLRAEQDSREAPAFSRIGPWPTYGRDVQRTHVSPFRHRPPFRQIWRVNVPDAIEFPPTVAYGRLYFSTFKGHFYALDAASGALLWSKRVGHCSPASPMLAHGVVFQAYALPLPCARHTPGARGFVIAWEADTGRELWRHDAAAVETSPLLVGQRLYFGSWDGTFYAVNARTGKADWTFAADRGVTSSPAYSAGTVFVASDGGRLFALDAQTGKLRWQAASFERFGRREYFYATPTVAYGRVYIGNADGTLYAFGAKSGRLLWARHAGTYVYTAAAAWAKTIYVGTWDGYFSAFDAATGELRWRHDSPGGISGAPTVMAGLVYYSTFGKFTNTHQRRVEDGGYRTFALDARTGKPVWQFPDGQYSPVVADADRVYLVGSEAVYGLVSRRK
ncbi:MAG: PQQ-binding-like beta-propeller repeat protein [Actinomycetota bacterium]